MFMLCPMGRGSSAHRGLALLMTDRLLDHLLLVSLATLIGTAGTLSLSWPFPKKNRRRKNEEEEEVGEERRRRRERRRERRKHEGERRIKKKYSSTCHSWQSA